MWMPGRSPETVDQKWKVTSSNWSDANEPRHVGAGGVERDVAEVEEARVADDDVQPEGHHRHDEHHHHRPGARHEVADERQSWERLDDERVDEGERDQSAREPPTPLCAGGVPVKSCSGARHAPSGVRSPRIPCGRNTSTAMRIPKTSDRVQSPPGVPSSPSLNAWTRPIEHRPQHGSGEVADASEHGCGERDQAELEAGVVAHVELQQVDEAGDRRERAREEERHRDRPVDVDAHHRRGLGVLRDCAHRLALPRRAYEPRQDDEHRDGRS